MISLPIGLISFFALLFFAMSSGMMQVYLNVHAIEMVVGGTVALLFLLTPMNTLKNLWSGLRGLGKPPLGIEGYYDDLLALAGDRTQPIQSSSALIVQAAALWRKGVDPDMFVSLIFQYKHKLENDDLEAIQALRSLSKYPSALGMIGTVTGLVGLFANLRPDQRDAVGPALATALTATFYGLTMAHAVVMPLADRMAIQALRRRAELNALLDILVLIGRGEPTALIDAEMRSREAA
jgi:chemotaxis protein MotA